MASTHELDPDSDSMALTSEQRPTPLRSLVAAAMRMKNRKVSRPGFKGAGATAGWQEDAWDMFDLVGEQRFLSTTLANRMGQARFFVGTIGEDSTQRVEPEIDGLAHDVYTSTIREAMGQMIPRMGINLFVSGDGWIAGTPPKREDGEPAPNPDDRLSPFVPEEAGDGAEGVDLSSLHWHFYSTSEVQRDYSSGKVTFTGSPHSEEPQEFNLDEVFLIRVWRPHPRRWWEADSPTRSSLPVLRELVGLTMHIGAQVDSRLAGAGVFLIPQSADRALRAERREAGEDDPEEMSPFASALMESMLNPIEDRSSASALVPLMPVVPDESIEHFRHISFSSPLDTEARTLRDEAIRRLALGQDAPPELLLGVGGMNHWGAWLVREDVVTTHLEPPLSLICDALTTQFLWPVLEQQGMDPEEVRRHVIWYDVEHMILRPNRGADAFSLHERGALSDSALRDAVGFDDTDAPKPEEERDPVAEKVMQMIVQAPSLAQDPGLVTLYQNVKEILQPGGPGESEPTPTPEPPEPEPEGGEEPLPDPEESDGPEDTVEQPEIAASGTPHPYEGRSPREARFVPYTHNPGGADAYVTWGADE